VVFLDGDSEDAFDNVLYISEVTEAQWRFECELRDQLAKSPQPAALHRELRSAFSERPQAKTRFGIAYASLEEVERVSRDIAKSPELAGRVTRSKLFEPGNPDAVDLPVAQSFLHTDLFSSGLLATGQQIELQVRLDGV
jgi:hypothetical protein